MSALKTWFATRSLREQRLLIAMAVIAFPVLFWLLVLRPLDAAHDEALDRYRLALERNGRIAAITGVELTDVAPPVVDGSLASFLTDHAAQRGLALASATDSGTASAQITMTDATPPEIARWIAALEADGLTVQAMQLSPTADGVEFTATVSVVS